METIDQLKEERLMQSARHAARTSKGMLRAGRIISALPVLFLIFDSVIKLVKIGPVVESFAKLGYPDSLSRTIGILELACLVVYLLPRTSVLGAILLTGYLGGATATHLRVGDPLLTHVFFPIYVGALIWGGLFLRDDVLRALIPAKSGRVAFATSGNAAS
jgi:hypothetical protein